jgi:hypothetical protein
MKKFSRVEENFFSKFVKLLNADESFFQWDEIFSSSEIKILLSEIKNFQQ